MLLLALAVPGFSAGDFALAVRWSAPLEQPILAAPAIDRERLYVPLRGGRLVALSLATGAEQWSAEVALAHGVAVDGGRVAAVTADAIVALDAATGRVLWRAPVGGASAAPAAVAGWMLVGVGGDLLAFRASDGAIVWRRPLGGLLREPATIHADRVYATVADGTVLAFEIVSGKPLWQTKLPAAAGRPTAAGDRVFVGCEDNFFYALDARDGDREWRWRTGADVSSPAAHDVDRVYFSSLDNVVRALDFRSGVQRWRYPLDLRPLRGPVLVGDLLLVAGGRELRAIRPKDGTLAGRWEAPAELAAPVEFPAAGAPGGILAVAVTGAAGGDWRVYGLAPGQPATEKPARPPSPGVPAAPRR